MLITTLYPNQNANDLLAFCGKYKVYPFVVSHCDLNELEFQKFIPGNLPPPDDRFQCLSDFLISRNLDKDTWVTILDWESVYYSSESFEDQLSNTGCTNFNVHFTELPVRVENYRLPPYMENIIMIANNLKLDSDGRLFKDNPYVLTPKVISGKVKDILHAFSEILKARQKFDNRSFAGFLPIINSLFYRQPYKQSE